MSQKNLKAMKCPTCGGALKVDNVNETITCVYCGNDIIPVSEAPETVSDNAGANRVEKIKTSSSALAYMELYFEDYDWDSFVFAHAMSVQEIDHLAAFLKVSSADDKDTWLVNFQSQAVPFRHKIASCRRLLDTVIREYQEDNLDAYSTFDAYKRIAKAIRDHVGTVTANLEKALARASKYGADNAELKPLKAEIAALKEEANLPVYTSIKEIPEIAAYIAENDARVVASLAADGIDARAEYEKAAQLIASGNAIQALDTLLPLRGYSDVNQMIQKIDRYYLIDDVLEINGKLYFFKANTEYSKTLDLYETTDGAIATKPLISNIREIITNYANILIYLDQANKICRFNLETKVLTKTKKKVDPESVLCYNRRLIFLTRETNDDYDTKYELTEMNLATNELTVWEKDVHSLLSINSIHVVYTLRNGNSIHTRVLDVSTGKKLDFGEKAFSYQGRVGSNIVYSRPAPDQNNQDLYVHMDAPDMPEILVEKNFFRFENIFGDKLFYRIGDSNHQTLISCNLDGTNRREYPLFVSQILREQGGWLYFIRRAGYNSVLCKARLDGSKFRIIATEISEFVELKNGYLYYINDSKALCKVRMDGSNQQKLCDRVSKMLTIQDDKVVFTSLDDVATSIYGVDFTGRGKSKLVYNIHAAKEYDENTVYYIADDPNQKKEKSAGEYGIPAKLKALYRLNVATGHTEKLLSLRPAKEKKKLPIFAIIAFAIALGSAFIALFFLCLSSPGVSAFFGFIAAFSVLIAILRLFDSKYALESNNKEEDEEEEE